jgi:predicted permease
MSNLLIELRTALRGLRQTPGFTLTAIVILGLGLGATVTIFTLVNALLVQAPPGIREPERLVRVTRRTTATFSSTVSYPDYESYRDGNRTLQDLAAYTPGSSIVLANTGTTAVETPMAFVSANYFDVLGTPLVTGRGFRADEARAPGSAPVALVSDRFWRNHLAASPSAVGAGITINGHPFTVVGVVDPAFHGIGPSEAAPDVWVPLTMLPAFLPSAGDLFRRVPGTIDDWLYLIGRLAPATSAAQAQADFTVMARRLEAEFPYWNEGTGAYVTSHFAYQPALRGRLVSLLRLLAAASGTVLLIACANLALLLLARASGRRREFGVRAALGAGRERIVGHFLAESLLLAAGGSGVAILVAVWSSRLAAALLPFRLRLELRPDLAVLGFAIILGLLTALLVGALPAWVTTRTDLTQALKQGSRGSARSGLRHALVAGQVALSLVLVAAAGLFVRSFSRAQAVELGFETENRLLATVDLSGHGYDEARAFAFIRTALERLAAIPGVDQVSSTRMIALGGGSWTAGFGAPGAAPPPDGDEHEAGANAVGPGYFRTLAIPLVAGREFEPSDDRTSRPVVIVNQALARRLWGESDPLGRIITRDSIGFAVVGVARDAVYYDLGEAPVPQLYFSALQFFRSPVTFVLASRGPAAALAPDVRRTFRGIDGSLAIAALRPYDNVLDGAMITYRNLAALVGLLGALALALAAAGLYGVLAYLVTQARREIAVRMALGARALEVAGRVVARGVGLAAIGVAAGGVAFLLLGRLTRAFLIDPAPADPIALGLATVVLLGVAATASYLPARRAARTDPMEALRHE